MINLSTLNDGQQDDDDEEKESNVEQNAVKLVGVTGRVYDLITDASTGSHTNIHVEQVTLENTWNTFLVFMFYTE